MLTKKQINYNIAKNTSNNGYRKEIYQKAQNARRKEIAKKMK